MATGILLPTILGACLLYLFRGSGDLHPRLAQKTANLIRWDQHAESLLLYGLNRRMLKLSGILIGALGMLSLGWLDDKHELSPRPKFIGQLLVAFLVASSGARITLFVPYPALHYIITMVWILTVVNAFNFMDNMNGLCAGLGVIGAW